MEISLIISSSAMAILMLDGNSNTTYSSKREIRYSNLLRFRNPGGIFPCRSPYRPFHSESFVTRIPVLDDLWRVQSGSSADLILLWRDARGGIRRMGLSTSRDRSVERAFPARFRECTTLRAEPTSSRMHRAATRPVRIRESCNHQSVM